MTQTALSLTADALPTAVRYVPILKAKDAEYRALGDLSAAVRPSVVPLLEVPAIPWDYEAEQPAKTLDDHIAPVARRIARAWPDAAMVYVDLALVAEERLADGRHPLAAVMSESRDLRISVVPVVGLDRSEEYLTAARDSNARDARGLCLRLEQDALVTRTAGPLSARLDDLLSKLAISPSEADLVIDLGSIRADDTSVLGLAWVTIVSSLPNLHEWRTLTFAATSFPQSLSGLAADAITPIPRGEWALYQALRSSGVQRVPDFGDYAISHPEPVEVDPRIMRMSGSIRYAANEQWLIVRGRDVRRIGWDQMHSLAAALVATPDFSGGGHCWGDGFIYRCATDASSESGAAMTWRRVGTGHHLTKVVEQLTSAPAT